MSERITSLQNPRVRYLTSLKKENRRKKEGVIVVEGIRENKHALENGFEATTFFYCPEILHKRSFENFIQSYSKQAEVFEIPVQVYEKVAYRESTEGIIGIYKTPSNELSGLKLSQNPLLLVTESVEKPGNLGALLRTADAANLDAVIVCGQNTDIYNPNVIRSSIGCVFTRQVISCTADAVIEWLKKKKIKIISTHLGGKTLYYNADFREPTAIIAGNEATGLSPVWKEVSDELIIIPMKGQNDSLNVSVSSAVVVFDPVQLHK